MPTERKANTIDQLAQRLRDSKGAVILDYRGLNVKAITELRRQLNAERVHFEVTKNTLLAIAAERAGVRIAPELLTGPTAMAFGLEDEIAPARVLSEYTRRNRVVSIKGGIMGNSSLDAEQVGRAATLPARPIVLSQLLGGLQAPMAQTLSVIQAPARTVAGLLQALQQKKQAEAA